MNLQKASLFFSVIAFVISIFALVSVHKMQFVISNHELIHDKFKPIKDVPDVEIIKPDGTVEKISAKKSQDELSKILNAKNSNNENNNKKYEEIIKTPHMKKDNVKEKKMIAPVAREVQNITIKTTAKTIEHDTKNGNSVEKIYGTFVVQIGAFKDSDMAKMQCNKAQKFLQGKSCSIATTRNKVFRSIVYPFNANSEATKFSNEFSSKTKINCLVKKNG